MSDKIGFKPEYVPSAPVQPPNYVDPNSPHGLPSHFLPHQPPHFPPQQPPPFVSHELPPHSPPQPPPSHFPPHFGHHHHSPHFERPQHHHPPHFGHHHRPGPPHFGHHHRPGPPHFGPPQHLPFPSDPSNAPTYPLPPGPPNGNYVVKGYYWVATNATRGVPPSAVRGGVDQDGTTIYVGRAHHEGDWIPAKVIPEKDVAYVAYGGKEHAKSEFQVLCEQTFEWVHTSGSSIPPEAVVGGQTSDGEPLYVGRVHHAGSHTIGKVQPSHGTCYIPFGGEELGFADYEVLVLRG